MAVQNHTLIFPVGCLAVPEAGGGREDGGGQRRGQAVTVLSRLKDAASTELISTELMVGACLA